MLLLRPRVIKANERLNRPPKSRAVRLPSRALQSISFVHASENLGIERHRMTYPNSWEDMSNYVVHFTKASDSRTEYDNMMGIIHSRTIEARSSFGMGRRQAPEASTQEAVCFSEIPPHLLSRLVQRRGRYGIGFSKQFMRSRGAFPIWYVDRGSPLHNSVEQLMHRALRSSDPDSDPIWGLTPFIDVRGTYQSGPYLFEWEREWRHISDFSFGENDVAFLIIPEELHDAARGFFTIAVRENVGPGYFCPYIDPCWTRARVEQALASGDTD